MDSDVLILVRWNCSASRLYSLFSFLMNSAECSGLSARILRSSASKTNETSGRGRTHIRTCSNGTLCLTPQNRIVNEEKVERPQKPDGGSSFKVVHVQMKNPRHSPNYETKRVEQVLVPYVGEFSSRSVQQVVDPARVCRLSTPVRPAQSYQYRLHATITALGAA